MSRFNSQSLLGKKSFLAWAALNIPFRNLVPTIAVGLFDMWLIERDGVFVGIGCILGVCGLRFNLFVGASVVLGMMVAGGRAAMAILSDGIENKSLRRSGGWKR